MTSHKFYLKLTPPPYPFCHDQIVVHVGTKVCTAPPPLTSVTSFTNLPLKLLKICQILVNKNLLIISFVLFIFYLFLQVCCQIVYAVERHGRDLKGGWARERIFVPIRRQCPFKNQSSDFWTLRCLNPRYIQSSEGWKNIGGFKHRSAIAPKSDVWTPIYKYQNSNIGRYFDQLLLAAHKVNVVYSDQLLDAAP